MVTHTQGSLSLLLISCVLSTSVSLPVLAAGDGVIVLDRAVRGHMYGRTAGSDPSPTTVNANPSAQIYHALNTELSDNDIAGISSGVSITRSVLPSGNFIGLDNNGGGIGLGTGGAASHNGSSSLSGTISGAVSSGLEPLKSIGSMVGGR
ncbi:hypothetical protein ICY20_17260 [Pseudomonas sp. P115]|uniref:hypothetical protein n=1 Tax=Pseudomonas pisciculturae TaxID=2730413 RepID=UPI001891F610|nr:hypothetical protein [Pseudomonas pisciculturae]MBF6029499.1 hypothetical protein [Pseudomonas pisciculturae]